MINKLAKLLSIGIAVLAKRPDINVEQVALKTPDTSTAVDIPLSKKSISSTCINTLWVELMLAETKPVCRRVGSTMSTKNQAELAELAQKYKSLKPTVQFVDDVYQTLEQQEKAIKALYTAKTTVELERSIKVLLEEQKKLNIAREILNKATIEYNKQYAAPRKQNTNISEGKVYPGVKKTESFNVLRDVIIIGIYSYIIIPMILDYNRERLAHIARDNDLFNPAEFDINPAEFDVNPLAEPDGFIQRLGAIMRLMLIQRLGAMRRRQVMEIEDYSTDDQDDLGREL